MEFTKSDLKTGMWLEQRNGKFCIVLLDTFRGDILSGETYFDLNYIYNDDLKCSHDSDCDAMKIYQPQNNKSFINPNRLFNKNDAPLMWERQEPKEMTVAEKTSKPFEDLNKAISTFQRASEKFAEAYADAIKEGTDKC